MVVNLYLYLDLMEYEINNNNNNNMTITINIIYSSDSFPVTVFWKLDTSIIRSPLHQACHKELQATGTKGSHKELQVTVTDVR
jgi:hypothetical protein